MPMTRREMLREPKKGDYWSDAHTPSVLVLRVNDDSGSVVVITDWVNKGGFHPDYTRARELSRERYLELLEHTTDPNYVGQGYRATSLMNRWLEIWEYDYHGHHALDLSLDEDLEERWTTIH